MKGAAEASMKIVLAPDSFKECLTAAEACAAMREGILARVPGTEVVSVPMADGGEGTMAVLADAIPGEAVAVEVTGPLGDRVVAEYRFDAASRLAIVEGAQAFGLERIAREHRDPYRTTTRGFGELVRDALARGARRLFLTIGGSSTVEGGTGLARALGYAFLDENGTPIPEGGESLVRLARIEPPAPDLRPWEDAEIDVGCDVTNPLLGPQGAARVFGPQKGATPEMVEHLEQGLARLAEVMVRDLGVDPANEPGAGAAGGLGAGLAAFVGARLRRGVDLVMEQIGLREKMAGADLVITGEGRTDGQSAAGKVCAGVGALAARCGIPCVVLSGTLEPPLDALFAEGVTAAFSICRGPETLEEALAHAGERLAAAAGNVAALLAARGS